jgi:putative nucleotidyltransferase with HDIG domain
LLGYERDELIGQPVSVIEAAPAASEVVAQRRRDVLAGTRSAFEARHRCKDGTIREFECSVAEIEVGSRTFAISVERDITERKRAEERVARSMTKLQALREIDQAIVGSVDQRVTLGILLDRTVSQLGVDAADVLLQNPHVPVLEFAAGAGFRTRMPRDVRVRIGEGLAGRAALERRTVVVEDLARSEEPAVRTALFREEGFRAYIGVPLLVKGRVCGVLEAFLRRAFRPDDEWMQFLEALAGQAAVALDNALLVEGLQRSNLELSLAYDTTIEGWSRALDLRDKETEGHSLRVTEMTTNLARSLGLSEADLIHARRGALLHDIGKVGIPDAILLKPGSLTDEEWVVMRRHPTLAHELLLPIAYLRPALDIPYCHHEKWDGTGYPRRLKGEEIPFAARIFAAVDVWDALRSDRPYRKAWPDEKIRTHITSLRGSHFDARVADAMLAVEWPPPPGST